MKSLHTNRQETLICDLSKGNKVAAFGKSKSAKTFIPFLTTLLKNTTRIHFLRQKVFLNMLRSRRQIKNGQILLPSKFHCTFCSKKSGGQALQYITSILCFDIYINILPVSRQITWLCLIKMNQMFGLIWKQITQLHGFYRLGDLARFDLVYLSS